MSSNWPLVQLCDLISIKHGFAFKGEFFSDTSTDTVLVTPGNFAIGGGFKADKLKFYNGPVPEEYKLEADDLIVTMTDLSKQADTLGYSALIPEHLGRLYLHNQRIGLVEIKSLELDKLYLYFLLRSREYRHHVVSSATGSTVKHTSPSKITSYEFHLPPLETQKNIGRALKRLEDKAAVNNEINQTLEQMAQAIFKSWFVDFEPVKAKIAALEAGGSDEDALLAAMQAISGKGEAELARLQAEQPEQYAELRATAGLFPAAMQDSELGEIPEGWECMALDQIAKYQNGLALQKFRPENEDDYLPVVKIAQLKKGYADHDEKASPDIKPDCIIDNGDVVFSWSGSLIVDTWCGGKAALNQHLFKVTSESYPKWLYFHFTRHHLEEFQRIAADKAVTMGHIKREHLKRALCAIPNKTAIENAGKILERVLSKQIELRLEKITLSELRDTLLPKLLSGELVLDTQLEEKGVVNV